MRFDRVLLVACLFALAVAATPAAGQTGGDGDGNGAQKLESLPRGIRAASQLSEQQQSDIRNYVDEAMSLLRSDRDGEVTAGRRSLLDPYGNVSSNTFEAFYGEAVLERLNPIFDDARSLVQLNAAIVASRVQRPASLDVARRALNVDDRAVRYWGAQILRQYAERGRETEAGIDEQQTQTIQQLAEQLLADEPHHLVTQPAMLALAALNTSEAKQRLIQGLTDRLTLHVNDSARPYRAERDAMRALLTQARRQANEGQLSDADVATLAGIACRYMVLASRQLVNGEAMAEAQVVTRRRTIDLADSVLQWSANQLDVSNYPGSVRGNGDWQQVNDQAEAWQSRLTESPYGLSGQDVSVPG